MDELTAEQIADLKARWLKAIEPDVQGFILGRPTEPSARQAMLLFDVIKVLPQLLDHAAHWIDVQPALGVGRIGELERMLARTQNWLDEFQGTCAEQTLRIAELERQLAEAKESDETGDRAIVELAPQLEAAQTKLTMLATATEKYLERLSYASNREDALVSALAEARK